MTAPNETRTVTVDLTFGHLSGNIDEAVARIIANLPGNGVAGAGESGYYRARIIAAVESGSPPDA